MVFGVVFSHSGWKVRLQMTAKFSFLPIALRNKPLRVVLVSLPRNLPFRPKSQIKIVAFDPFHRQEPASASRLHLPVKKKMLAQEPVYTHEYTGSRTTKLETRETEIFFAA